MVGSRMVGSKMVGSKMVGGSGSSSKGLVCDGSSSLGTQVADTKI